MARMVFPFCNVISAYAPISTTSCTLHSLFSTSEAQSGVTVSGQVTDGEAGETLPTATVQVEGTYRGTVTNQDGAYRIEVPAEALVRGEAHLVVRFVGYETVRVPVRATPTVQTADVVLRPAALELGTLTVTEANPADVIMRRVIEQKARWQSALQSWRAEAHTRQVVRREDSIIAIVEGMTEAYWTRGDGLREIVKARRSTANLDFLSGEAFSAADQILNFYDDEIPLGGFKLMGPTHPEAPRFYRFAVVGTRVRDGQLVYDLTLRPRSPLQPGFTGQVSVLDGAWALLSVELQTNEAVQFPLAAGFELSLGQQYSSFGRDSVDMAPWLPVDFRLDGETRFRMTGLSFPALGFRIVSRLTDYAVNVPVPDALFSGEESTVVDSGAVAAAEWAVPMGTVLGTVPLSEEEIEAYATIDSTETLAEAFQPTGPLARFIDMSINGQRSDGRGERPSARGSVKPEVWFNRVDALRVGANASGQAGHFSGTLKGAYRTGSERLSYTASVQAQRLAGLSLTVRGGREAVPQYTSVYGRLLNSAAVPSRRARLTNDYYEREGGFARLGWHTQAGPGVAVSVSGRLERHRSLSRTTSYDLLGRDAVQRDNPAIVDGDFAAVAVRLALGSVADGVGATVSGQRGLELTVEHAADELIGEYDYTRFEGDARWSLPTLLQRRLLPMTLHARLFRRPSMPARFPFSAVLP